MSNNHIDWRNEILLIKSNKNINTKMIEIICKKNSKNLTLRDLKFVLEYIIDNTTEKNKIKLKNFIKYHIKKMENDIDKL
jgi:hypothetical protein